MAEGAYAKERTASGGAPNGKVYDDLRFTNSCENALPDRLPDAINRCIEETEIATLRKTSRVETPRTSTRIFKAEFLIGGPGGNRTHNLSIKSRMLCQLSYRSILYCYDSPAGRPARQEQNPPVH